MPVIAYFLGVVLKPEIYVCCCIGFGNATCKIHATGRPHFFLHPGKWKINIRTTAFCFDFVSNSQHLSSGSMTIMLVAWLWHVRRLRLEFLVGVRCTLHPNLPQLYGEIWFSCMSVSIFWCLARHWDTASTWHLKTNVLQNLRFRSARSMLGLPMLGRESSLETLKISADLQTGDAQNIVLRMNLPYPEKGLNWVAQCAQAFHNFRET